MRTRLTSLLLVVIQPSLATQTLLEQCPPVGTLEKQDMLWSSPLGWKSYDPSFSDQLSSWKGAQFSGTQVGSIICLYQGEGFATFPVGLQGPGLYQEPKGTCWEKKPNTPNKTCICNTEEACAFHRVVNDQEVSHESAIQGIEKKTPLAPQPLQ